MSLHFDDIIAAMSGQPLPGVSVFPSVSDPPFVGGIPPVVRPGDPASDQVQTGGVAHVDIFDLAVPEQRDQYVSTLSRVFTDARRGHAKVTHIDRQFLDGRWIVYFEWLQFVRYDPLKVTVGSRKLRA